MPTLDELVPKADDLLVLEPEELGVPFQVLFRADTPR